MAFWRDPRACTAGGMLAGCHPPGHVEQRLERLYVREPAHVRSWMLACAEDEHADDCSVGPQSYGSPGSDDEFAAAQRQRGGRAAKARARADLRRWAKGQWVKVIKDVTVGGRVVCSAGGCAQISVSGGADDEKVCLEFNDESNNLEPRKLMLVKERVELIQHREQIKVEQRMKQMRARREKNKHADVNWSDWMDRIEDDDDDDDTAGGQFVHPKSGRKLNAPSALAAAKKAWKSDKKQTEVTVMDSLGNPHTFSSAEFATAAKDGVRHGGPKFVSGKLNKRKGGQASWSSFSPLDDD